MESLTSLSHCRVSAMSVRENRVVVVERCFLRTRKVCGFGLLSSVLSQQSKAVCPLSCVLPKTQVELEEVSDQTEGIYQSKTVHVKFQLEKQCWFGQQFHIVGNDPVLGLWDPETAVPLNWSDRHVWYAELDIPVGKSIQYKFILKDGSDEILWQPGPDRVFEAFETENTIVVSEDWENSELQVVTELDSNDVSDEMVLSEQVLAELSDDQSETDSLATSSNKDVIVSARIFGNNGRATISLLNYEGEPVLVPGLPPFLEVLTEEENNKVEVFEAKDLSVPEIQSDEQCYINNNQHKEETTDEETMIYNQEPQLDKEETTDDETMIYNQEPQLESDDQQMAGCTNALNSSSRSIGPNEHIDIILNDLQWGQETLQRFFSNFRLF